MTFLAHPARACSCRPTGVSTSMGEKRQEFTGDKRTADSAIGEGVALADDDWLDSAAVSADFNGEGGAESS